MEFAPVGHLSANMAISVDLTSKAPWVYVIVAPHDRLIYIGETSLLIERLSDHFGPYINTRSTFRRAAARAGCGAVRPPFVVIAARLPADDHPHATFDASSKKVRQLCEALVHSNLAQQPGKWWIISTPQAPSLSATADIEAACSSISACCTTTIDFLAKLTESSPFNLVILSEQRTRGSTTGEDEALGALFTRIEVRLHQWLLEKLRSEHGERWWIEGVPKNARVQCVSRKEEEGTANVPPEAYLTFVDLRDIIRTNWVLFGSSMERMTGMNGKDRATHWLVQLNDIRKLWAHPIKQLFLPISQDRRDRVLELWRQLRDVTDSSGA